MLRNKRGLTLIEILLVIVILGLLSSMIIPRLVGRAEEARGEIAKTDIRAGLTEVLDLYELDNGQYPASLQDLYIEPSGARSWKGPYIKKKGIPKDPWGGEYLYRYPGLHNTDSFDLFSAGGDGVEGNEDDVNNWET